MDAFSRLVCQSEMELARAIKVGKEMGKAAARELEAAGTTARAGQKR